MTFAGYQTQALQVEMLYAMVQRQRRALYALSAAKAVLSEDDPDYVRCDELEEQLAHEVILNVARLWSLSNGHTEGIR